MFFRRTICQPTDIEVRESPLHGCGVFAKNNIARGTLIEEAPALFLTGHEKETLKYTGLFNYYFLLNNSSHPAVFGFGYASFYNHSSPANAFYAFSPKKGIIRFYAYKKIKSGEEVTINYNGRPGDSQPVYFPE
ncbi:MAG: SET domain-containing protein-lysine N-methyltransferase [Ferruginibacter sp.]